MKRRWLEEQGEIGEKMSLSFQMRKMERLNEERGCV